MANWDQIVSDYEEKIVKLEAETLSQAKAANAAIIILSMIAFAAGLFVGLIF